MQKPAIVLIAAVTVASFGLQGQPNTHTDTQGVKLIANVSQRKQLDQVPEQSTTAITASYTAPVASAPVRQVEPVHTATGSEQDAKMYIYMHESGNNPARSNGIGCFGLGQDCNRIVLNKCGADYACQDEYFTNYMLKRYGSWSAAKSFWDRTDARPYPGHWW